MLSYSTAPSAFHITFVDVFESRHSNEEANVLYILDAKWQDNID